jgi:hypothetical protein
LQSAQRHGLLIVVPEPYDDRTSLINLTVATGDRPR